MDMEEHFELTEKEYFNLSDKERTEIAQKVISIMKNQKLMFLENDFESIVIPLLKIELRKGQIVENYMICDNINRMLKILETDGM